MDRKPLTERGSGGGGECDILERAVFAQELVRQLEPGEREVRRRQWLQRLEFVQRRRPRLQRG